MTSRSSARRLSARSSAIARRAGVGRQRCPRSRSARGRCAWIVRSVSARRCSGGRAERCQAPGQQAARRPLGLEQGPQREQVVAEGFEAGSRARSPARSASAPRPARCPPGARRETRLQKARSSSSCSAVTTSIPWGRPPAPSASGRPGARRRSAPRRARRSVDAAVAEQPQRAQQVPQHRLALAEGQARGRRPRPPARRPGAPRTPRRLRAAPAGQAVERVRVRDRQARRERQLGRGDRHAVQRRHERHLAGARRAPSPRDAPGPPARARGAARSRDCSANTSPSSDAIAIRDAGAPWAAALISAPAPAR